MTSTKKISISALCLALCMVLPFFTGQIPRIGNMISPMHIPVFLCGFLVGPLYGAAVGFIAPFLRYMLFHMPPIMPTGTAMAFEMLTYGMVTGMLYPLFHGKKAAPYLALIAAMLAGRAVWGVASLILYGIQGNTFTLSVFLSGAFLNAIPAIILHLVIIPPLVTALKKAGV